MRRYTTGALDKMILNLRGSTGTGEEQNIMMTAAAAISQLMTDLRQQEYRLRTIEATIDGYEDADGGDFKLNKEHPYNKQTERLQKVREACPWDDDNKHDSWFFSEEEATHPVRIRKT